MFNDSTFNCPIFKSITDYREDVCVKNRFSTSFLHCVLIIIYASTKDFSYSMSFDCSQTIPIFCNPTSEILVLFYLLKFNLLRRDFYGLILLNQ